MDCTLAIGIAVIAGVIGGLFLNKLFKKNI